MPAKAKKRRRLGDSTVPADRLKAEHPNHVWALDFQHDATADGRELKFLNVVDEFTREALAIEVERTIDAEETVAVLERLAAERGAPANLRADNGPELTAAVLREWCRAGLDRHRLHRAGLALAEPLGRVLQLPPARRGAGHRDVHLLAEARLLAAEWRDDYNANHPHSALGMMAAEPICCQLAANRRHERSQINPELSLGVDR